MFWTCVGHVLDMCCICFGYVLDMFWTCVGHVLDMFWTCLGYVLDMFGTEDVILVMQYFLAYFFENNYFLFGGKKPTLEEL